VNKKKQKNFINVSPVLRCGGKGNDQFNTAIHGLSDLLRGVEGSRNVLLMNSHRDHSGRA